MKEFQRRYLENTLKEYMHLYENKDHLINRLTSLTPEQKEEIVAFFHKYPNYENKIDWNRKDLTFEDFKPLLANAGRSQTQAEKKGLAGIKEGVDYIVVDDKSPKFIAYQPLTYLGSKTIASNLVPPSKENGAKWCTAYQKTTDYWDDYTARGIKFIYICDLMERTKYAIVLYPENLQSPVECYSFRDVRTEVPERYKYLCSKELKNYKPFDLQEDYIDTGYLVFNKQTHRYDCPDPSKIEIKKLIRDGKFIISFGNWNDDFKCIGNYLTTLEGAPEEVSGDFDCSGNNLQTLLGSPKKVCGNFNCSHNQLTTLAGAPEAVGGDFKCYRNYKLTNLKGAPEHANGNFDCSETSLMSLEGSPKYVGGSFDCYRNRLTTLKGSPEYVGKHFNCSNNELTSLEGSPKKVGGNFYCLNNQLTNLEGAPEHISDVFYCDEPLRDEARQLGFKVQRSLK